MEMDVGKGEFVTYAAVLAIWPKRPDPWDWAGAAWAGGAC